MSVGTFTDNIEKHLFSFVDLVEHSNSLNRNDRTVDAENVFCAVLNSAFGWDLKNANEIKSNQEGFDLTDPMGKLLVQVTSNKNYKKKLDSTIAAIRQASHPYLTRVIILFIAKKCPKSILNKITADGVVFEGWDISKLIKNIYHTCKVSENLETINSILEREIEPIRIKFLRSSEEVLEEILPTQSTPSSKKGLQIDRSKLLDSLFKFGQYDNGLVVGGPGVGKSYTLNELQILCRKKSLPCYIIRINELLEGNDTEIGQILGLEKNNWIKVLKNSYSGVSAKAILIFDAFDTAKNEKIKAAILSHINKAIRELGSNWSILVSVRSFDASKSSRLIELFPHVSTSKTVSCRKIEIPELTDSELTTAINTNQRVASSFKRSTDGLKKLLKIPYFLKLYETIVIEKYTHEESKLATIETEEQLLNYYWEKKVIAETEADIFLQKLTSILVLKQNLSCPKSLVLHEANATIFNDLASLGIIEESVATKQTISFKHNILLEYAISRYKLPESVEEMVSYINQFPKMPFGFRQSFIYFYSRLWHLDNKIFWEHYFKIRAVDSPSFRLFHQTVLNFVLGGYYKSIEQLEPVFNLKDENLKGNTIKRILEGIRFINKGVFSNQDYDLLYKATSILSSLFFWELGLLLHGAIAQLTPKSSRSLWQKATISAQNYLKWVIQQRKASQYTGLIDANGWYWAIKNICDTFFVSKTKSSKLLKQVLEILKENNFPLRPFDELACNIIQLFKEDVQLGNVIFQTLYSHVENSNEETKLGSGVVMALRSNRRQDYEMTHHRLEKAFEKLLTLNAEASVQLGAQIINQDCLHRFKSIEREHSYLVLIDGEQLEMIPDFHVQVDTKDDAYGIHSFLTRIFGHFSDLLRQGNMDDLNMLMKVFLRNCKATIGWKRLLRFVASYPNEFTVLAFELLQNVELFICNETTYEAGELLKVTWQRFSKFHKNKLQEVAAKMLTGELLKENRKFAEKRVLRFLSCIPESDVDLQELKAVLQKNSQSTNTPLLHYSGLQPYNASKEEQLFDAGADITDKLDTQVFEWLEKLQSFSSSYDKNSTATPSNTELSEVFFGAKSIFDVLKQGKLKEKLSDNCAYEVARYVRVAARNSSRLNKTTRKFVEEVAFFFFENPLYKQQHYEEGNMKDRIKAYGPTPRTEAATTLILLVSSDKSERILTLIKNSIADNSDIIRHIFLRAINVLYFKSNEDYWRIIKERIQVEKDGMCFHDLLHAICYDNIIKENQKDIEIIAISAFYNLSGEQSETSSEIWQMLVVLLLKLVIKYESSSIKELINENLNNDAFARSLIFEILAVLDPRSKKGYQGELLNNYDYLIAVLSRINSIRFKNIKTKGLQDETINSDFSILDEFVQRVSFIVGIEEDSKPEKNTDKRNKEAFYLKIKPLLIDFVKCSSEINSGFMVAHTGYYFMQLLNTMLYYDTEFVLSLSSKIVGYAAANNFTYDQSTMGVIVKLTEKLLADHKNILKDSDNLNSLITILDQFANSGWQEPLELTWRLKEVF